MEVGVYQLSLENLRTKKGREDAVRAIMRTFKNVSREGAEAKVDFIVRTCPDDFVYFGPWPANSMDTDFFRRHYGENPDILVVHEYYNWNGDPDPTMVSLFRRGTTQKKLKGA